ncbi:MAG: hypothetical protein Q9184_000580 [Pyrenodesmia sp. 2 TL-2023]
MHIRSIPMWVGSSNNYAYLVTDEASKDAVIIDPANPPEYVIHRWCPIREEHQSIPRLPPLKVALRRVPKSVQLSQFKSLKLPVIGGKDCDQVTKTPKHEESFKIGQSISVKALHTPCHTQDSICWLMEDGDEKVVFTGDTLFIGGTVVAARDTCGDAYGIEQDTGGTTKQYQGLCTHQIVHAIQRKLSPVQPGHEYTKQNVKFLATVLQTEPVKKLRAFAENNQQTQGQFTIGDEKEYNVFMRLDDPTVQKATGKTDPVDVMGKLREMKNNM